MWRQQLNWYSIADDSLQSIDIKNKTILLEDLNDEIINRIPIPYKENLIVTDGEKSPSDMTYTPTDNKLLSVYLNWILQREWDDEDYTVDDKTITFADELSNNDSWFWWQEDKVTVVYYYNN